MVLGRFGFSLVVCEATFMFLDSYPCVFDLFLDMFRTNVIIFKASNLRVKV